VEEQLSSSIRILIADDFRGWRLQNRLLLQARPEWQVIAEASDGSEAVQKAEELKPDLILLDIGLPKLNGIEAARQIRQLSPSSKIVFLSLHNSLEVVQAALSTGAMGYVRKTDSLRELLPAVDTVLEGKPFISSSLRGSEFTDRLFRRSDLVFSE
jgi:DNA-binding NarL/FixJ family response regulator